MLKEIWIQLEILFFGRPSIRDYVRRKLRHHSEFSLVGYDICFKEKHVGYVRKDSIFIFTTENMNFPDADFLSNLTFQYNKLYQPKEKIYLRLDDRNP